MHACRVGAIGLPLGVNRNYSRQSRIQIWRAGFAHSGPSGSRLDLLMWNAFASIDHLLVSPFTLLRSTDLPIHFRTNG